MLSVPPFFSTEHRGWYEIHTTSIKMAEKQKTLLPTLKEKKRYIAYKIHSLTTLPKHTGHALVASLQSSLGIFDAAQAGLMSITFDSQKNIGIIRSSLASSNKVRMAMLLTKDLNKEHVMIQPLLTSGVLNKCKNVR